MPAHYACLAVYSLTTSMNIFPMLGESWGLISGPQAGSGSIGPPTQLIRKSCENQHNILGYVIPVLTSPLMRFPFNRYSHLNFDGAFNQGCGSVSGSVFRIWIPDPDPGQKMKKEVLFGNYFHLKLKGTEYCSGTK
jgi:hypothetical protein